MIKKRKIMLYIRTLCRGGAERVMVSLAEKFILDFDDVIMVNDFPVDNTISQYDIPATIKRYYLREDLKGNPVIKNVERIIRLRKLIKEEKPDIILSFLGSPNIRMLLASYRLPCVKFVSVRNDPIKEYGGSLFQRGIANALFRLADGIVLQTEEASKYFSKNIRKKSSVICNPVADTFFDVKPISKRENIVSVGRLEPQKNQLLLIDAFAKIADEFPEERLLIYGEGSLQSDLQRRIDAFGLTTRIILCGVEKDIASVLAKAKIFVLSSDYEGMPNALMEAMAVGLACVSTDCPCGGPKEIIEDEVDGILFPCGDVMALAEELRRLERDDETRIRLGDSAREKAECFRSDIIYKRWIRFFEDYSKET